MIIDCICELHHGGVGDQKLQLLCSKPKKSIDFTQQYFLRQNVAGRPRKIPKKFRGRTITGDRISNATPLTNNPIPDPTSQLDYYMGKAGDTIPNATPLTSNPIPDPTSLLDYSMGKGREAIDRQKQREAELSEGMRLDAEHSAPMKLDAELSERMKPEAELSDHMQLDAELSERGRRSPEPRDPWRSLSPIPGFEMESSENQYDSRSTTIDAAANSVIKRPTYQGIGNGVKCGVMTKNEAKRSTLDAEGVRVRTRPGHEEALMKKSKRAARKNQCRTGAGPDPVRTRS
ncbi:hypothetical protein Ancab_039247 [Ancistrocladus abbreviatus]